MQEPITSGTTEELINASEENFLSYTRAYAAVSQNNFIENDKIMLSISDVDGFSMINNCVSKSRMAESEVKETLKLFKDAGKPVMWTVFPATKPENIQELFKKNRIKHIERNSLMHCDMTNLDENHTFPEDLFIKEVDDIKSLKEWTKLYTICFGYTDGISNFTLNAHADLFLDKKIPGKHYIAYLNDKPVGTASVFMANGVAGLYNITTAPEVRGRGIGEALTRSAMIVGKKAGYIFAILQATKKGQPLYEKIGYKSKNHMDFYVKLYGMSRIKIPLTLVQRTLGSLVRTIFLRSH